MMDFTTATITSRKTGKSVTLRADNFAAVNTRESLTTRFNRDGYDVVFDAVAPAEGLTERERRVINQDRPLPVRVKSWRDCGVLC